MRSWVFAVIVTLALLSVWCLFRDAVFKPVWVNLIIWFVAGGVAVGLPFMAYETRWKTLKNVLILLTVSAVFTFSVVFFAAVTIPASYQAGHPSYLQGHKYTNVLFLWSLVHLAVAAVFGVAVWCVQRYKLGRV